MKKTLSLFLATGLLAGGCQTATESQTADGTGTFSVPYEKYTLDNGLDVILHQDTSDPIVAVAILYHVGSNREKPGKTGFAHFFEHMLFQSSENLPKGAFFTRINDLGGTFNGGTWTDGTIYYETVPKDALEKVLWMESDRMGFFINTVTEASLENEKLVVKNEKRQRYDNQPYGHTRYVINQALYPKEHPYNWLTIGSLADLQAATLEDVKAFYDEYYGPNNATLVIAGDIEKDQVKAYIEKYFGEIKAREEVQPLEAAMPELQENVKLYHEDNYATVPELRLTFPGIKMFEEDAYALDILADLLSEGKRAPLYKVLVEQQKLAPSANSYNSSSELAGTFTISVRAFDNTDLDQVYTQVMAAIDSFALKGFSDKDLQRIKNLQETNFYNGLNSIFGKAQQLAYYNEFAGSPEQLTADVAAYKAVDREDVMRVFNTYLKGQPHIITSFVPKGKQELMVEGSVQATVEEEEIEAAVNKTFDEEAAAKNIEKTPSKLDRTLEPELGPAPTLKVPAIWTEEMENGLQVYGIQNTELPLVQVSLRLMGGSYLEDQNKPGIVNLLADLMMEGTANKTPEELEDAIGLLGANISIQPGKEYITLYGNSLARNYEEMMRLINEIMLEPRWDEQEFARLKEAAINRIQQRNANPNAVASEVYNKLLYGQQHVLAQPLNGTIESVKAITLEDLKKFYADNFVPSLARFHVVGAVSEGQATEGLGKLAVEWTGETKEIPSFTPKAIPAQPSIFFVDVPNAKQSVIRIGKLADLAGNEGFTEAKVANYSLGQGSGGQLFKVLREEKGYTYGAYSYFDRAPYAKGSFTATSSVQSNVTREAVETFKQMLTDYSKAYDEAELEKTKTALIKKDARDYETLYQKLGVLQNISTYQLPQDYMKQEQETIRNMSLEEARAVMQRNMNPDQMIYLVVGDAASQLERLKGLGLGEPTQLDKQGNPVNEPKEKQRSIQ